MKKLKITTFCLVAFLFLTSMGFPYRTSGERGNYKKSKNGNSFLNSCSAENISLENEKIN